MSPIPKIALLTLLSLISFNGKSQTFGNEWINYGQQYYSFPISQDGIYRIDYSTLQNAGVPIGTFSSENIQLFGKEKEVALFMVDGNDMSFDPGDYFIFYGERNDGWLDSSLYINPLTIGNPGVSLYNDTLRYFFTWNTSTSNLRFVEESDVNFSGYTPSPYILTDVVSSPTGEYHEGQKIDDASSSFFVPGEGWGAPKVNGVSGGYTASLSILTPTPYTGAGAPEPQFLGLSVSNSDATFTGIGNHHLRWRIGSSSISLLDTIFTGYRQIRCDRAFPASQLVNGNTPLRFDIIDDQGALTDFQAYTYYKLRFPQIPDFQGVSYRTFFVDNASGQSKIRLDIANAGFSNPIVMVLGSVPRIVPMTANGSGIYSLLIPNDGSSTLQKVVYKDQTLIQTISAVKPVNGTGNFTNFLTDFPTLDSALLMIYHESLLSASQEYANYRSSLAGGGYNVIFTNVDELYDQFGGGVEKHVHGIRRFAHFVNTNSAQKPSGLFLMGKGIREANYSSFTSDGPGTRFSPSRFEQSLIPSFGHPSSDVDITAGLEGPYNWVPLVPTGRISARTNQELQSYLDKVVEYETNQNQSDIYSTQTKDWQKQIIHFAGGSNQSEQILFQYYMGNLKDRIEDSLFGGNVMNVYKNNSNPLDPTVLSSITDRISEGVSILSYFGHSSATNSGFEINLDEPENWNNTGKYPLMLVNSCYNGNIFQLSNSKSEQFVQVPNYGAIGYIASTGIGFAQGLYQYSLNFYGEVSKNNYGSTLGEQMKNTIQSIEIGGTSLYLESTCSQMVLNGDPMIRLNHHDRPEIELTSDRVYFTPEDLDLTVDSIEIHIVLTNLGRSVTEPFTLEITRNFPQSIDDSLYTFYISDLNYKDTFSFKMPMQPSIGIGLNTFTIAADIPSQVSEQYDELGNNQISKTLFIDIDGILPVIPWDFAVVPDDSVTVKASTINPIAAFNTYRFEIDTTDLFNSPEHRFATISGYGGVKEVNPSEWLSVSSGMSDPLVCEDSMVYFWRAAIDEPIPNWREFSFQHITGKTGWGQDHFFQFKKNGFNGIDYDRPTRERLFGPNVKELKAGAYASPSEWYLNQWTLNGDYFTDNYGLGNFFDKLHVAVIDPVTLEPWYTRRVSTGSNLNNNFGNNNDNSSWYPDGRPMNIFTFRQDDPVQLDSFQSLIQNRIPDGFHIVIYSPRLTRYDLWNSIDSTDMYDLFTALGSDSINGNLPNRPFAFYAQKGNPASAVEDVGQFDGDNATIETFITGYDYLGSERSTRIGPAAEWGNVYWKQDPLEAALNDSTGLTIRAYDITGSFQFRIDTLFTANDSLLDLNNLVDASQYPYINLEAFYLDSTTFTPSQIDRWHVLYQPLPEAAIDGSTLYTWTHTGDTLEEGETVQFAVDVKNIYSIDMDSLLISYWIEDGNSVIHPIPYTRQDSLRVGQVIRDTVTISTVGLSGINSLWMVVNPYINGSLYVTDQPEQEHFNNVLQLPFFVNPDDRQPLLDVTFNGTHVLNGDIIDPNSEILITLKDDNPFIIMDNISDTTLFGVYLTDPNGLQKRIPFIDATGNTVMQWIPATAQNRRFKILWPSDFKVDGTYTLFVQGADRSGNLSGDLEYRVSFEVIHASTITRMMNYPNPFSTSTRFVFTLTGSEEPDEIIIQIMTVSGRVVREITEDQLGTIRIGRNITEYAWDGTDEFGDPLANGVYLYRVKAQIKGESIEHRDSGADSYFTKDFGKMYLLR